MIILGLHHISFKIYSLAGITSVSDDETSGGWTHLGLRFEGSRAVGVKSWRFFWERPKLRVTVFWRGWHRGDFPTVSLRSSGWWCSIRRDTDSALSCSSESPSCSSRASATVGWPWTTRPFLLTPDWDRNETANYQSMMCEHFKWITYPSKNKTEALTTPISMFPVRAMSYFSQVIIRLS